MSLYPLFDRRPLELGPLAERGHDLRAAAVLPLQPPTPPYAHAEFPQLVARIRDARRADRPVILFLGAHPIKLGLSRYLIDLVERRLVTHVATNGAGIIHDFELANFGGTSEDVARWIRVGRFGMWQETSRLNEIVAAGAARGEGVGEAVGRLIVEESPPWRALSLAAACYRAGVPLTAHVGIGSDIVHSHPNCDGAAWGAASYTDFLIFTQSVAGLEGGVFLNFGSAVAGPEVYLKALSMVRNVAAQQGGEVRHFATAMFDLVDLPDGWRDGPPSKEHAQYYYRPWKTILVRTIADGGESFFFRGDHRATIPTLWHALSRQA